jgi:hypothetical protein
MLIEPPHENRREFLGGSKSLEIFDEHDVAPAAATTPTTTTKPADGSEP